VGQQREEEREAAAEECEVAAALPPQRPHLSGDSGSSWLAFSMAMADREADKKLIKAANPTSLPHGPWRLPFSPAIGWIF
jgi:hypothetical protein